jgi:hypothetical protein
MPRLEAGDGIRQPETNVSFRPIADIKAAGLGMAMMYPPSLPADVKERAFHAANGELGILPDDAASFLASCRADGIEVLGWELWVVDHAWRSGTNGPVPAIGLWCGGIPVRAHDVPAVIGGEGNADETGHQLAAMDLRTEVHPEWLPHVRVNFTLDG